jgi:predicted CXXCH cytochrome family protein
MTALVWVLALLAVTAILVVPQLAWGIGRVRAVVAAVLAVVLLGGGWWLLERAALPLAPPAEWSAVGSVSSETCAKCHPDHYDSWHRTYHRTMTRDATPENVKGDFDNAVYEYLGQKTWLTREGDTFFMKTVDADWELRRAQIAGRGGQTGPPQNAKLRIDRLVGSHWVQEYMHRDGTGKFNRLPVLYHIVEKRWVHSHGAFLAPEPSDFWAKCRGFAWNDTCLYCHNTGPTKNPIQGSRGETLGYKTEVAELGISCEACHGPGAEHVSLNQNPARRFQARFAGNGDPSVVHPERLPVHRRDEICARCHGALVPKNEMWNKRTHHDPFIAGQELGKFNHFFHSEAEQHKLLAMNIRPEDEPVDGRFWADGTPLTTALEYNGMALSACYEKGHGKMSCLSCHQMHGDDPNFMLKPGMKTNDACYQCHDDYRDQLASHSRHAADSSGSLCYNCHMPHQVYSLFTTHRSHRIQIPDVKETSSAGKPNACNLCHLDKSLGWTQEQLARWPNRSGKPVTKLSEEEKTISSAVLLLARGDARSRAIVAAAFSNPDAQRASGSDWFGPFLTRLMDEDRYPIVRYLAHRGLRTAHGEAEAGPYDYLAAAAERAAQTRALRQRFDARPIERKMPFLPLTPGGLPDDAILNRLLKSRHDPNLTINE